MPIPLIHTRIVTCLLDNKIRVRGARQRKKCPIRVSQLNLSRQNDGLRNFSH